MNATVLPSRLGFHCDGDCWHEDGGVDQLVQDLERQDKAKRDWFVQAIWANEAELKTRPLPPMDRVHPIQDYVVIETMNAYRENLAPADQADFESHPTLFIWRGKTYIFQGTHRLAALYTNGATHYHGWLVSLDA